MRIYLSLVAFLLTTLPATRSLAQVRIVPEEANVVVGDRVFQLLDSHGAEITADDWSVADSSEAEINIREGRAFVTFNSVGEFTVKATSSGKLAIAHVNVLESSVDLQKRVPWVFSPIYESFPNVLHAWAPDADGASFFYEDRGPSASMIRAIREDGIQLWTWPAAGSAEMPKMICGNMSNGVLLSLGKSSDSVLVMLDGNGKEMWRHPAPGFTGVRAFTFGGTFFIVQDDPVSASSRVIGLDASTGAQTLSVDLPRSRQVLRNLVQTKKGLACSPGSESTGFLPIRHSELQTGADGVSHLSFAVMDLVLDGENCVAGQPVSTDAIALKYSQKLQRLNLHDDGVYTFDLLETNSAEGPAAKTPAVVSIPSGDIIPDYTGEGNFIAVRRTVVHWPNMSPGLAANLNTAFPPKEN